MEAQGERKYSSYSFITSSLDGVSGQCHAPAAFYPRGKEPRYPLGRRLGGPQSRSKYRSWRKSPFLRLPVIEPWSPGHPVRCQTLYWLNYPCSWLNLVPVAEDGNRTSSHEVMPIHAFIQILNNFKTQCRLRIYLFIIKWRSLNYII
jgi:hypothetical protein